MTLTSEVAAWTAAAARYWQPRRLRTRAMGTLFWVRYEAGDLIVVPGSGNERHVIRDEFLRTWGHIDAGTARATLRQLTNNGSYLEAIYDDLRETAEAIDTADLVDKGDSGRSATNGAGSSRGSGRSVPDSAALPAPAIQDHAQPDLARRLEEADSRLRALRNQYATAYRELESRLHVRERELTAAKDQRDAKISQPDTASRDRPGLELRLVETKTARDRAEAALARTRAELDAVSAANASRVAVLEAHLGEAQDHRDKLLRERNEINEQLQLARTTQARKPEASRITISLSLNALNVDRERMAADPDSLGRAARSIFTDPSASVAECRRVIERSARSLWSRAGNAGTAPNRFGDVMAGLRGAAIIPDPDWHLIKNLYARASGVVHEGGATPDIALWIWLGTLQVAELTVA